MAKYRGVTWNNAGAGPKVKIRRSIWLAELQDFGAVADAAVDLPTAGAVHRAAYGGSKSGTREFVDLSTINDLAVVYGPLNYIILNFIYTFFDALKKDFKLLQFYSCHYEKVILKLLLYVK